MKQCLQSGGETLIKLTYMANHRYWLRFETNVYPWGGETNESNLSCKFKEITIGKLCAHVNQTNRLSLMRVGMNGMHFELAARMKQRLQSRGETLIKLTKGNETTSTIQRRDIDQTTLDWPQEWNSVYHPEERRWSNKHKNETMSTIQRRDFDQTYLYSQSYIVIEVWNRRLPFRCRDEYTNFIVFFSC